MLFSDYDCGVTQKWQGPCKVGRLLFITICLSGGRTSTGSPKCFEKLKPKNAQLHFKNTKIVHDK